MFNKQSFALADITHESKYQQGWVYCHPKFTAATDGKRFMLITAQHRQKIEDAPPGNDGALPLKDFAPFLIPVEEAKKVMKNIPKSRGIPILQHAFVGKSEEDETELFTTDLITTQKTTIRKDGDVKWYDFKKLFPRKKPILKIALSAELLSELLKAFIAANVGGTLNRLEFSFYGEGEIVQIKGFNQETRQAAIALIMPMQ